MIHAKICFGFMLVIFTVTQLESKSKVSLQKAFDTKHISAKAICAGGLELNYSVCNLTKDSLIVMVPAGWRFNSNAGKADYQDILVTHDELLVLKPKETKQFLIKGYCCEVSKSGPQKGVPYTPGKLADSNLVVLARYLNTHAIDKNTEQYSVWAISDNEPTANITCSNDSVAALLRNFVSTIKGEPLPWYTLLKRASISNTGNITNQPIKFNATITYAIPEPCYTYCYILDANGQQVSEIFGEWLYPQNNQYQANFKVSNLKKGSYKLVLVGKSEPLFEKEFKI